MPRVLFQDLRERVVAAVEDGMSCRAAAGRFGGQRGECDTLAAAGAAARDTGGQAARRRPTLGQDRGSRGPDPRRDQAPVRHCAGRAAHHAGRAGGQHEHRDARAVLLRVTASGVKKDRPRDRAGPFRQRRAALGLVRQPPDRDPDKPVFIDETWASTNMARHHGRCRRGERLRAGVPFGHWKTTSFVRRTGMVARPRRLSPPSCKTDRRRCRRWCSMNRDAFLAPSSPVSAKSSSPSRSPATS